MTIFAVVKENETENRQSTNTLRNMTTTKQLIRTMMTTAVCLMLGMQATAQTKALYLSSVNGSNVEQYDGQTRNVTMYRSIFNGWNTLCLPFSMTTGEVNEAFGSDCRLEILNDVKADDNGTYCLYFRNAKQDGLKANTPYILYYTGENKSVKLTAADTKIEYSAEPKTTYTVGGVTISLIGTTKHIEADGQYGIYVKNNAEADFTPVENSTSGFYATRCYIKVDGTSEAPKLLALHNTPADTTTGINSLNDGTADNGEVYNMSGVRQNKLQKGVNIIQGQKVIVR